jgi:hypothetical protein
MSYKEEIDRIVDEQVGAAIKEYMNDGLLNINWFDRPEPIVSFCTPADDFAFENQKPLLELLIEEVEGHRPGGGYASEAYFADDADDLFFDPDGDRRVVLLQALIRTYLDWKKDGVHVSKEDGESVDSVV